MAGRSRRGVTLFDPDHCNRQTETRRHDLGERGAVALTLIESLYLDGHRPVVSNDDPSRPQSSNPQTST